MLGIVFYIVDLRINEAANYEMIRQSFIFYPTLALVIITYMLDMRMHYSSSIVLSVIKTISEATFGMFLFETCTNIKILWKPLIDWMSDIMRFSFYHSCILDVGISFVFYLSIVLIIKKIPLLNKLI